jgi:hypothetical protein
VKGDYRTTAADTIEIPVVIDSMGPKIDSDAATWAGDLFLVPATDAVYAKDDLEWAFGSPSDTEAATDWDHRPAADRTVAKDLSVDGELRVFVRDPSGNVSTAIAKSGLGFHGAPGEGGCNCDSRRSPGTGGLVVMLLTAFMLTLRGRGVLVEDSIGMVHLAVLIANPRQEIQAADLVAGLAGLSGTSGEAGAAQRVLDPEAIAEYRTRLRRLDTEIDELEPDRARQARAERDWLVAQLSSAAGFGGRTRAFPDQPERARVAVGKAIRRALARITEADGVIGEHLRQTVHTGVRCSYWPG